MSEQDIPYAVVDLNCLRTQPDGRESRTDRKGAFLLINPYLQREKALTHEIEYMHQFQAKLIQTSNDGIIANDRRGRIIIFNEGAEKILGYRKEEVIDKIPVQRLFPPGLARKIKEKICSSEYGGAGQLVLLETQVLSKGGKLIPVELSASIIYEGTLEVATVGFFRDLRERKQLQEKILQAERLAVLGKVAAHISHEIKNPLMIIGGFAHQIMKNFSGPPKDREKLQIIIDEIKRLEEFLAEVGSFVKFADPHLSQGDLNTLIQEICLRLEPTLHENSIKLLFELDPKLPKVNFDPVHLRQVIINIVKNGLEAMPLGGTLTIGTGRKSNRVFIQISDTGTGINPEIMERIIQPFYSTKTKGSGLGLTISQKIMKAHQGELIIESELHRGSKVTLFLRENS